MKLSVDHPKTNQNSKTQLILRTKRRKTEQVEITRAQASTPAEFAQKSTFLDPYTRTVGDRGLNASANLGAYTPVPSNPSSMGVLVPSDPWQSPAPGGVEPALENGCLFSGPASGLDAFSPYRLRRGCPAVPCRTTGRLEAAAPCSSRTRGALPSGSRHPQQVESDLSHDGLNPAHVPF